MSGSVAAASYACGTPVCSQQIDVVGLERLLRCPSNGQDSNVRSHYREHGSIGSFLSADRFLPNFAVKQFVFRSQTVSAWEFNDFIQLVINAIEPNKSLIE